MKTHIKCNLLLAALVAGTMLTSCAKDDLTPKTTSGNGFTEQSTFYHEPEQLQHRQSVEQNAGNNQDSNPVALNSVEKIEGK